MTIVLVLGYRGFTIYDLENTTETKFIYRGADISIENQLLEWTAIPKNVELHCKAEVFYFYISILSPSCILDKE
jgi:hypothetical protein